MKEDKALLYLVDGLHVLFRGDFHQLPLVGDRRLYHTCIEQEASNTRTGQRGNVFLDSNRTEDRRVERHSIEPMSVEVYEVME